MSGIGMVIVGLFSVVVIIGCIASLFSNPED
jgi:hypothetical protein